MSLLEQLKLLRGGLATPTRRRKTADVSPTVEFFESSRIVSIFIFILTVAAIVIISFVGVNTVNLPVLPNQLAAVRIVADEPFAYESPYKTTQLRDQLRDRVPPAYTLELTPFLQFDSNLRELVMQLENYARAHRGTRPSAEDPTFTSLVDSFNAKGPYRASAADVALLLNVGEPAARRAIVENGLATLREIYRGGVYDTMSTLSGAPGAVSIFQIRRPNGDIAQVRVQSMDEALSFLHINLSAEGVTREISLGLFRIFKEGLTPNLVYDREASLQLQQKAIANLKPVTVSVERGQTIIEPGTRVTLEQHEMLLAQRKFLLENGSTDMTDNLQLFGRVLLVLAMVMASIFYIRLEDRETLHNNGRLGLLALVVIVNLTLVRLSYSAASLAYFSRHPDAASLLPYLAPTALAPLVVAILIDHGSAIFMALLISIFTGVIYGSRLDLLVLTFFASMVGIFRCRAVRKRGEVVRAGTLGGFIVAIFALLIGVADQLPFLTVLKQMTAGVVTGLLTGVAVAGVLPVLEGLFKRTTDITLLELTDYNHPLLRLMQMETPGTYHHSLVVALLAENASNAIGANPLVARVCALFHDVGKTTKPEYFTENQRAGVNLHDTNNPSLSALIIKSHVKEGVDLALKYHLPRTVIDVIQEHHGTTLIRYFYQRARTEASNSSLTELKTGTKPAGAVCETTYRYDGPKPQFKESAIIHLADAVEAASRTLRKLSPQHLGEIIDQIFRERIEDGQLEEAPITFEELSKIKSSFTFTLLNMLHGRVSYRADENPEPSDVRATL